VPPEGIAVLGNNLFVADTGNNRIVKFDTPSNWPPECVPSASQNGTCPAGTAVSPPGIQFIGQQSGQTIKANQGLPQPNAATLNGPTALVFAGTDLYVADTSNNRVLIFPQTGGVISPATRLLGQLDWGFNSPNLIEGRELFIYAGADGSGRVLGGAGIAVDTTSNPPHLYIADSLNNRILGFRDARNVTAGNRADIVIGQADFFHSIPNFATGDLLAPTDSTLVTPEGLAVDANGNLYVADAGNGRVLRFPKPFDQTSGYRANLVLGQAGFFSRISDPTSRTMRAPYGLAFTQAGHLLVSDAGLNRVLLFRKPTGGDFSNGQTASAVFGQPDFTSSNAGSDRASLNGPRGIAVDSSDRLYVCDTVNNRVSIFTGALNGDTIARFTPSISMPQGIAINSRGEVWVASLGSDAVIRFPQYDDWFNTNQAVSQIAASHPFAIGLDGSDNPIVAEALNRVSIYYQQAVFRNAASYSVRGLAPGELAYIARLGPSFSPSDTNETASALPWPKTLADTQVLFNGVPAAIYRVSPDIVTFQVPTSAPVGQFADVQIVRASTAEVLAAASFRINSADPAFFTSNAQGFGQIAAINEDGSVNTPANPAGRWSGGLRPAPVRFYSKGRDDARPRCAPRRQCSILRPRTRLAWRFPIERSHPGYRAALQPGYGRAHVPGLLQQRRPERPSGDNDRS
jgi:sugar lactone lactonase YvrE